MMPPTLAAASTSCPSGSVPTRSSPSSAATA